MPPIVYDPGVYNLVVTLFDLQANVGSRGATSCTSAAATQTTHRSAALAVAMGLRTGFTTPEILLLVLAGTSYQDACYKPFTLFDGKRWPLWYNGRYGWMEQIALVPHDGEDL